MNDRTKKNKETELLSIQCPESRMAELIGAAKRNFDQIFSELKLYLVEFLISSEREMLAGPQYQPNPGWEKWGAQRGSVYIGGERLKIKKPRLRKEQKEVQLPIYQKLRERGAFSEKVLEQALRGLSCRDYAPALDGLLDNFGVSKSSVSRHIKTATTEKLKQLKERGFEGVDPFAIFIDG